MPYVMKIKNKNAKYPYYQSNDSGGFVSSKKDAERFGTYSEAVGSRSCGDEEIIKVDR